MSNLIFVAMTWLSIGYFGLAGTGVAFFGLYVVYGLGICLVVRRVSGFRWSAANRQLALLLVPIVSAVFVAWYVLPRPAAVSFGALITVLVGGIRLKCSAS